jgi:hypothetical protein
MYHNLKASLKSENPCDCFCDLILDDRIPSMESIRRIRQKLQEEGLFPKESKKKETSAKHHSVKDRVEYLLKQYKPLRDDDKKLWISYLITYHHLQEKMNTSDEPYDALCTILLDEAPAIESIRRCRQILQEKGLYLEEKRKK